MEQLIKEAKLAKEKLARIPGKGVVEDNTGKIDGVHDGHLLHSVIVDEEYTAIASHINEGLRRRIILGEYIDLARLLPRDSIQGEEDQRMEMVNRGGLSYWVPISDRNSSSISNIVKWEEAFRIFSSIYTEGNPSRGVELIQYCNIIHEAALEYPWEMFMHMTESFIFTSVNIHQETGELSYNKRGPSRWSDTTYHQANSGEVTHTLTMVGQGLGVAVDVTFVGDLTKEDALMV